MTIEQVDKALLDIVRSMSTDDLDWVTYYLGPLKGYLEGHPALHDAHRTMKVFYHLACVELEHREREAKGAK